MKNLKGIMSPMITPFKENGEVDYEAFAENIENWGQTGLSGFVALGSNSETPYLNKQEKLELVRIAVKHGKGKTIIAGTGMETPGETINLTNQAADLGADYGLVLTPNFFDSGMTSEILEDYYREVADHVKIPILLYNVPKFTHVNMEPALVGRLADHPNILGIKDSSGNMAQFAAYINAAKGKDFSLFVGTAGALYPALALGADGGILALANCNPKECTAVYDLFCHGRLEEARELYQRLLPINTAVTGTYGIAGLKTATTLMGYRGGHVRKPLKDQTGENIIKVGRILENAGVL